MKNLEHTGNHFQAIARDPQILLDFPRGCERFPENHKDPQGKGRKEEKNVVYIYIASLSVKGVQAKKKSFDPPS